MVALWSFRQYARTFRFQDGQKPRLISSSPFPSRRPNPVPMGYAFLILGDRQALSTYPGLTESTAIYHLGAFYLTGSF